MVLILSFRLFKGISLKRRIKNFNVEYNLINLGSKDKHTNLKNF